MNYKNVKHLTGKELHQRFLDCIENKLDFVTLKPLGENTRKVWHIELKDYVEVNV